jgi:hypothetical protein
VRLLGGERPETNEYIGKSPALLAQRPPVRDVERGSIDVYYWFWGGMALAEFRAEERLAWNAYANRPLFEWEADARRALVAGQQAIVESCDQGSWDAIDAWGGEGGRVYMTAMACLCLSAPHRYDVDLRR